MENGKYPDVMPTYTQHADDDVYGGTTATRAATKTSCFIASI